MSDGDRRAVCRVGGPARVRCPARSRRATVGPGRGRPRWVRSAAHPIGWSSAAGPNGDRRVRDPVAATAGPHRLRRRRSSRSRRSTAPASTGSSPASRTLVEPTWSRRGRDDELPRTRSSSPRQKSDQLAATTATDDQLGVGADAGRPHRVCRGRWSTRRSADRRRTAPRRRRRRRPRRCRPCSGRFPARPPRNPTAGRRRCRRSSRSFRPAPRCDPTGRHRRHRRRPRGRSRRISRSRSPRRRRATARRRSPARPPARRRRRRRRCRPPAGRCASRLPRARR